MKALVFHGPKKVSVDTVEDPIAEGCGRSRLFAMFFDL